MRTLKMLSSVVTLTAIGTVTTLSQVRGQALTTAQAEIITVPTVRIQPAPKMTPEGFGILISCQIGYQGGLDDDAIARCVEAQTGKGAAE